MRAKLILTVLFFSTITAVHAEWDLDTEINKIEAYCFSKKDLEALTDNALREDLASFVIGLYLIRPTVFTIGNQELRKALGYKPRGPWPLHEAPTLTQKALDDAPTLEAYYELKELNYEMNHDNKHIFERNVIFAVEFLDRRIPEIRNVFKNELKARVKKTFGRNSLKNRKMIDKLIEDQTTLILQMTSILMEKTQKSDEKCDIRTPPTTPVPFNPRLNETEELSKIDKICEKKKSESLEKYVHERAMKMLPMTLTRIGLGEARSLLGLRILPANQRWNHTEPGANEAKEAKTIEAYYYLKEPRNIGINKKGDYSTRAYDTDQWETIADKEDVEKFNGSFPSIRIIFRHGFEKILMKSGGEVDVKTVDEIVEKFKENHQKILAKFNEYCTKE